MADRMFYIQDVLNNEVVPVLMRDILGDGTQYALASYGLVIGTYTERSGTITTGGTAQVAMAANAARKAWFFQNISTADLWISLVETAQANTPGSVKVAPGAVAFSSGGFVSTQALSVVGATTGQKFTLWEG